MPDATDSEVSEQIQQVEPLQPKHNCDNSLKGVRSEDDEVPIRVREREEEEEEAATDDLDLLADDLWPDGPMRGNN